MRKELGVWQRNMVVVGMFSLAAGLAMYVIFAPLFLITSPDGQTPIFGYDLVGTDSIQHVILSGLAGEILLTMGFFTLLLSVYKNDEGELWCGCCFIVQALIAYGFMPLEVDASSGIRYGLTAAIDWGYWVVLGLMILPLVCIGIEKAIGLTRNCRTPPANVGVSQKEMSS